jgi:hypothetical protein
VPYAKKRRVESLTRLPTKRLATACWDFIVVKSTELQTAPLLDLSPLQAANTKIHQQVIHKSLWTAWGQFSPRGFIAQIERQSVMGTWILASGGHNLTKNGNVSACKHNPLGAPSDPMFPR